ncbi:hypothetical protein ACFCXC_18315 [Streptomyces microflavus]
MDDTERQRLLDANYTRHQSRAHARWLEKKLLETFRQHTRELAVRLIRR